MKAVPGERSQLLARLLAAAVAAALLSTLMPGLAHSYNKERMEKDISIMENVINTAMIESELVYVFDVNTNVRGLYIPEFGALFTLQGQLTSDWASPYLTSWRYFGGEPGSPFWTITRMDKEKLGKLVDKLDITVNGKKVTLDEYFDQMQQEFDYEYDEDDNTLTIKKRKEYLEKRKEHEEEQQAKKEELREKNLEKFQQELATLLADYGGTIRQLDEDQWVMIVAYLGSSHKTTTVNKLKVSAMKEDLDLYDHGEIEFEELISRMNIETD
jgi:hypothetical protein